MTAVLVEPVSRSVGGTLSLERNDINFANITPERVAIAVTLRNRGDQPSEERVAIVQAAPLGAFVPWRPLDAVLVPSLEPGESFTLRLEARRGKPAPLGPPDRLPPQRLLTALGAGDGDGRRAAARRRVGAGAVELPADPIELMGRRNPHWAGNLNIFVNHKPVERHLAQALRIYPGRVNAAMFVVGQRRDQYRFSLAGDGADWDAALYDMAACTSLRHAPGHTDPVALNQWLPAEGMRLLMLAVVPPARCRQGTVEVHVEQRSTGRLAVVEFSLDAAAAGPGCYVVG
jgi:hypothetical protein